MRHWPNIATTLDQRFAFAGITAVILIKMSIATTQRWFNVVSPSSTPVGPELKHHWINVFPL